MKSFTLYCFLSLLLLALSCSNSENTQQTNVLLIIIDTLNADHLGCYGYGRDTSPTIDSLAASGILFANCQAQAPWTLPGMTSIYTGLTERSHRCSRYDDFSQGLDPEIPTLPLLMQQEGYSTVAAVNTGYLGETFGMEKGYDYFWINEDGSNNADLTVDTLLSFFTSNQIQVPYFATIHLFDPHLPYDPPAPFDTLFKRSGASGITDWSNMDYNIDPVLIEHMTAMYDSEIRWTDYQLSRLFYEMNELKLLDNTFIVLIADHGEEFMEHGDWGHAHNLYQQALHVPMIISGPGIEPGTVISRNVGQFDLLPTVLEYLGTPVPDHVEGISVLGDIPIDRIIPSSGVLADTTSVSCLQESSKVIWFIETDSTETFNLAEDSEEMNLLPTDTLLLEEVMSYWAWPCIGFPTRNELYDIEMKRLEGLGYIR